jgi:hypothetical protein
MTRTTRSTPAKTGQTDLPTPTPTQTVTRFGDWAALLDGTRAERTHRAATVPLLGRPVTASPASTPVRPARGTPKANVPTGSYPIQPANGATALTPGDGMFWAIRTAHPTSGSCLGDVRIFRLEAGCPFNPVAGAKFDSYVKSDGMSAGTWEVRASRPDGSGSRPVRINRIYPIPAAS